MSSPPSSSFDGTHMRERHSSSNSTSSRPPASSSSSSLPPSSTNPTTHPISLDTLLAQHANAPNPPLAALDQALSERNIFSTQNTQLWKLIEKQRSGYNQVIKELERMRTERDTYKARLQAAGLSVELAKKDKDKPKSLRPSASNTAMSITSENGSFDPRATMVRHTSDTSGSRNDNRPATPPRSQDVHGRDLQAPHHNESSNMYMPPAIAPPRSASLPQGGSSTPSNQSPSSSLLSYRSNEAERAYTRVPTSVANNTGSPMLHCKPSQQSTISSGLPMDANAVLGSYSQTPLFQHTSNALVSPQAPSLHSTHPTSLTPHSSSSLGSSLLSPIPENYKPTNRNSNVSLPDEAKHYIANMDESPLQSPGLMATVTTGPAQAQTDHGANTSKNSPSKLEHVGTHDGDETEFLDMEEEEDGVEEAEQQQQPSSVINRNDKSADADDFPTPSSHGPTQAHRPSHTQSVPSQTVPNPGSQLPLPSEAVLESQSQSDSSMLSRSQSSLDSTPLTPHPDSPSPESYLSPTKSTLGTSGNGPNPTFRALPLIANDLKTTRATVSHSSIRPNDRGKEVLSFEIEVDPGKGKEPWKVEKLYSDVLGLDHRLRAVVGRGVSRKIATLPEGKLWRDHAPAKSDQRKAALEVYLQSLIDLPVKNKDEVIAFLTSDVVRDAKKPVMQAGHKEGYLTKRGKNFGGWKTRYFVLQGPVLEYYESRGGTHLGSITITNAQIGRQQRTADSDDEKNYRHAFLIIEAKKGPAGSNPRHVLCAESDLERDSWVDILVRYVTGTFNEDSVTSVSIGPSPIAVNVPQSESPGSGQPRSSVSSNQDTTPNGKRGIRVSKDDISRATVMPIFQLAQDTSNSKLFQSALLPGSASIDESYSSSPTKSVHTVNTDRDQSAHEEYAKRLVNRTEPALSSSLPTSSPLEVAGQGLVSFRSSSELGHYTDMDRRAAYPKQDQGALESGRSREVRRDRKSYHPGLAAVSGSPIAATFGDRASSPDVSLPPSRGDPNGKVKISGPLNGVPIPAGYKFGSKDAPSEGTSSSDRREKAKSRSFWNFGKPADRLPTFAPRAVFGVPLDESLDVAEIARLPAVVFRCIQYLEAKEADQEEGIYRLSGSSAVIKGLKDRFNAEGDVDLLASDEYWDPHAIAGLLKGFLRELPASILTRELHMRFLSVMDFVEPQERIHELSHLIASLPIANYSLLRALTAHLILIVQNSAVNKMTMRNVGIVFSPTLGIPAGVFSLMLGEFNRVFNVDAVNDATEDDTDNDGELSRRNSRQYSDAAADQLLGLAGRTLHASTEETPSEDSDISTQYDSGNETTENDAAVESSQTRSSNPSQHSELLTPARAEFPTMQSQSHAAHVAASRGLNIAVTKRGNRHSRVLGLPVSPRPPTDAISSPISSPKTAKQS
ncbi:RhoGAP-domain-containing protein [Imleria badia]|nr:RhoGAP-domain-containing protein [Imleria badia]